MLETISTFEEYRLSAIRSFAQTLIVVDDEAVQDHTKAETQPVTRTLRKPGRGTKPSLSEESEVTKSIDIKHFLDSKALVDKALELGLVCSIMRPSQGEDISERIVKAGALADIMCFDWEIYNDEGNTAKNLIAKLLRSDAEINGRMRLIAIYTGDKNRTKIINSVYEFFQEDEVNLYGLNNNGNNITGKHGLRIVVLLKAHGVKLPEGESEYQVTESQLPEKLLSEYSMLSQGLLSNVAFATIASVRMAAHHIISEFDKLMDGPYFHHRSTIDSVEESESYAVDIILSELKSAIDRQGVAKDYAGAAAVNASIKNTAGKEDSLKLKYTNGGEEIQYALPLKKVSDMIVKGFANNVPEGLSQQSGINPPTKKIIKKHISSLFASSTGSASMHMMAFASLTGVRSFPGSYLYITEKEVPSLGLGSIVRNREGQYFICLQASCDSVRLIEDTSFLFTPLELTEEDPEHVVPLMNKEHEIEYIGLSLRKTPYASSVCIPFKPNPDSKTVSAIKCPNEGKFYYISTVENLLKQYEWVANLKRRRALRVAQGVAQDMGRIGFDEFEPFRRK